MTSIAKNNPCGLNGFAFLEFSGPSKATLHEQFTQMGFYKHAQHQHEDISWFQQGDIQFIINTSSETQAARHAKAHGPGACAMGFRVENAAQAFDYAIKNGGVPFHETGPYQHNLPAIEAIGGSVIYFVDEQHTPFKNQWQIHDNNLNLSTTGLIQIDHLTHNVFRGQMDKWANFYETIFNFHEIRFFNIVGQITGLTSRALSSPCGKIKIPLNESKDDQSQIEEFLHAYQGEGIQHIALTTDNIYRSITELKNNGVSFLDVPNTYYDMIYARVPWHKEPLHELQALKILLDGTPTSEGGLLLQIFTENIFGPVFFEIIQRKGNDGFGEGNFQALFEAIERDQIKRGVLAS